MLSEAIPHVTMRALNARAGTREDRKDSCRTVLVVADKPLLVRALADRIGNELVRVRWAPPAALDMIFTRCYPWPWLIVGTAPESAPHLSKLIGRRPVLVRWLGEAPAGLPAWARALPDIPSLFSEVEAMSGIDVGGVRLAPLRGIACQGGDRIDEVAELEALLAADPTEAYLLPRRHRTQALRAIDRHSLPLTLELGDRSVRIVPLGGPS